MDKNHALLRDLSYILNFHQNICDIITNKEGKDPFEVISLIENENLKIGQIVARLLPG